MFVCSWAKQPATDSYYVAKAGTAMQGRNNVIQGQTNEKERGRQAFDSPFELGLGVCFQQKCYGGWGSG